MHHVLNVWQSEAGVYLDDIVEAVDRDHRAIVKVRAGHILEERIGLDHVVLKRWQAFAQRGGSRRLDPSKPYAPVFSEKWMISLNA